MDKFTVGKAHSLKKSFVKMEEADNFVGNGQKISGTMNILETTKSEERAVEDDDMNDGGKVCSSDEDDEDDQQEEGGRGWKLELK